MRSVKEDESLHGVVSFVLLDHRGHFETDAGSVGVSDQAVGSGGLDLLHLVDVELGNVLDGILRDCPGGLEAVGREVALHHDSLQRGGNSFDGVDEEDGLAVLNLVALDDGELGVQVVDVDSHLEELVHLLFQHGGGVLLGLAFSLLLHVQFGRLKSLGSLSSTLSQLLELVQGQGTDVLHGEDDVVVTLQGLFDLNTHKGIQSEVSKVGIRVQLGDIVDSQNVGNGLEKVSTSDTLLLAQIGLDVGGDNGMVPVEEVVKGSQARGHSKKVSLL